MKSLKLNLILSFIVLLFVFSCKKEGPVDSGGNGNCEPIVPPAGVWKPLGLGGKLVSELVLYKNFLYACAGRDGLYRLNLCSENSQWEYLGLADTSIERTLESGVTDVLSVSGHLLVSYVDGYQHSKQGVYRSTDNGLTWLPSDSGMITTPEYPMPSQVLDLEVSPVDSRIILAGTSVSLVYLSSNGGLLWQQITGTVGASAFNHIIRFNSSRANEVWVGGETGRFAPYLLHSMDLGLNWRNISFPPNIGPYTYDNAVYDIAIDPTNDSILYFGMLGVITKTTDKGETFQRILGWKDGIYRYWRLAINPSNPQELLATGFYLYRTTDGGKSWQRITPPDNRNELYALAVDWQQRVLFVSAFSPGNGIYKLRF